LALGGGIMLIYLALNKRPATSAQMRRRRSGDGKVIYLFNEKAAGDGSARGASDVKAGEFTDAEYSRTDAEEPDDDGKK
jgi:hypothetical protein